MPTSSPPPSSEPQSTPQPKPKPFSIALSSSKAPAPQQRSGLSTPSISFPRRPNLPSSSLSSRAASRSGHAPTSTSSSTPRPRFHDHDSDEASGGEEPAHEEVTGFDQTAGGAISRHVRENKEKEPLVIKVDGRNGWRERLFGPTRAKKSWLPDEVRAQREAEENQAQGQGRGEDMQGVEVEGPSTKFGLTYAEVKEPKLQKTVETTTTTSATEVKKEVVVMEVDSEPAVENKELSQEEAALQALIRESKGEAAEQRSNLIIKSQAEPDNDTNMGYDETRSFRDDVSRRPEPASLAAYAAVPVEQFGAALLRGMGWKEGQPVGRGRYSSSSSSQQQDGSLAPRIPERRPGYLGIGAKDLSGKAGSAELELGAWGKAAMRKAKPGEGLYTPVLMKNKKTGEMMTEEDFKKLAKEQEKEKEKKEKDDEWKERRDKNLSKNGRRYDDGDDDYKRSRESSSRRNGHGRSRSSSADGHRDRDRDRRRDKRYEDNYEDQKTSDYDAERRRRDDRRYRDRDYKRERGDDARGDRDKDRDRNRDWDRTRSKYDDSGKDKDRDRYKERERDRNRDRDRRRDYR